MGPINHIFSILCHYDNFKQSIRIFNSAKNSNNHFFIFLFGLNSEALKILKPRINSYFISLIDVVGVDLTKVNNYNLFFNIQDLQLKPIFFERCVTYNILDYKTSSRYTFWCFSQAKAIFTSLENTFSNANWLERELVEFFNISLESRSDTRNLLLDYNFVANPLLKSYPTEGHQEIFFNHLTYNLEYVNSEFVEL